MTFSLGRLTNRKNGSRSQHDRVIHVCLWLATFLIPFFFLPFTTDVLEINKALLFYLLVIIAGVTWLLRLVVKREGGFLRSPLDVPVALFVLFSIVATLFSLYHYRSLVGVSGYFSGSLVSTLMFVFFFFLLVNTVRKEEVPSFLNALLLSGAVLVVFNFLQVFGFYLFPWDFTHIVNFNAAVSSPATLTLFLALIGLMSLFRIFALHQKALRRPLERGLLLLLGLVSFFLLMVYDQYFGWYALILGLLLFIVLLTSSTRQYPSFMLVVPTVILGIALVGVFVNTQSLLRANLPGDVQLPLSQGASVGMAALKASPLVGFGQETFQAVFGRFRPDAFNTSEVWNLRFIKSANEWLQLLASVGILGALAFLAVIALFVRMLIRGVRTAMPEDPRWWQRLPILSGALILIVSSFVLPWNFLSSFLFWVLLGLGVVAFREKEVPASSRASRTSGASFGASLGFSLAVILGIIFLYFGGRFWVSDMKMAQANRAISNQEDLDHIRRLYADAIDLNPYENSNYFALAQNLLVQAQLGAQKEDADVNQLRVLLSASIASAKNGAERFAKYGESYEALGQLYRNIDDLTGTLNAETKEALTRAIDLEPNNPQLYMNMGQYQLSVAQQKSAKANEVEGEPDQQLTTEAQEALAAAKAAFESAVAHKSDFLEAKLNISLVLRLQQKKDEAVAMLEDLARANPFNVDVLFNLAENYRIDERTAEAETTLERIISIFPGHSDSHFRLAQIYEDRGNTASAITELETVAKINPDNEDVKTKLAELKGE